MTFEEIVQHFPGGKMTPRGEYEVRCTGHEDRRASLGIRAGKNGGVVMKCQAGCPNERVLQAVGLTLADLAPPSVKYVNGHVRAGETVYVYHDEQGGGLFEVVRTADKHFWQRLPGQKSGGIGETRRVLFELPDLLKAPADQPVFIVEGEKDCWRLRKLGLTATTNPGGAGKWLQAYTDWLKARLPLTRFVILADNDEPGLKHAEEVEASLKRAGLDVRSVLLPDLPPKGDVSDWLARGKTKADLLAAVTRNGSEPHGALFSYPSSISFAADSSSDPDWPDDLAAEAFHGVAGEIVNAFAPQTEADPAALLLNLLVTFGNMVGREPHTQVLSTRHGANLFAALVGSTGEGSKGSSWDPMYELFEQVDSRYAAQHIVGGLASGEGLISLVRDRSEKRVQIKDKKTGRMTMEFDTVIEDEGVTDKRRLVLESEMSSLLKIMARPGNVLSEQLRMAWEKGNLQTVSKGSPARATGAHISLLGHITPDALRTHLTEADAANGFGNRFLFMLVRRSQYLPEGGVLPYIHTYIHNIQELIEQASVITRIDREAGAKRMWAAVYEDLRRPGVGMFGELTARRAPIVARLSLIYALLDGVRVILPEHLLAALAVWERSEASVRFLFGDATGDPTADALYEAMVNRPEGASRTDLHAALGRNRPVADMDRALTALQRSGRAAMRRQKGDGGREGEVWVPLSVSKTTAQGVRYVAKAKAAYESNENNENKEGEQ